MMSSECRHCENLKERIVAKVRNGKFGKVAASCAVCGNTWVARRDPIYDDISAVLLDTDQPEPRQRKPEPRQAFVNDPRRRGPQ